MSDETNEVSAAGKTTAFVVQSPRQDARDTRAAANTATEGDQGDTGGTPDKRPKRKERGLRTGRDNDHSTTNPPEPVCRLCSKGGLVGLPGSACLLQPPDPVPLHGGESQSHH